MSVYYGDPRWYMRITDSHEEDIIDGPICVSEPHWWSDEDSSTFQGGPIRKYLSVNFHIDNQPHMWSIPDDIFGTRNHVVNFNNGDQNLSFTGILTSFNLTEDVAGKLLYEVIWTSYSSGYFSHYTNNKKVKFSIRSLDWKKCGF